MVRTHHATPYFVCPDGGIGRRAGLKIQCPKGRAGSMPAWGTNCKFASLAQFGPEHLPTKQGVARSNRARRATKRKHSLNGKAPDSKSACASDRSPGSSPGTSAIKFWTIRRWWSAHLFGKQEAGESWSGFLSKQEIGANYMNNHLSGKYRELTLCVFIGTL